jgi:hypothetical protein
MVEHPVPRAPRSGTQRPSTGASAGTPETSSATTSVTSSATTPEQQQAIAHARGRICKQRNCEICAERRERRRLSKARRKADAQAQLHAKGQPCGRSSCPVPVCVEARHADAAPTGRAGTRADEQERDPSVTRRRQSERHRAGVPCGSEVCAVQVCVDGFASERTRRHRAKRPCRSAECTNPVCVASRSLR